MECISAAMIVLSGSVIFATGATVQHNDTQTVICLIGSAIGLFGLWAWATAYFGKSE